jgi:hypothetical protein
MREIDETFAYIVREECNAALRWQAQAAEVRVSLARLDGRFADASTHQTRANRLRVLIEPHDPVSPPIPAAARKPRVGEVWVTKGGYVTLLTAHNVALRYWDTFSVGENGNFRVDPTRLVRPATPEEAEPFRPFMEVLMRSLGETE